MLFGQTLIWRQQDNAGELVILSMLYCVVSGIATGLYALRESSHYQWRSADRAYSVHPHRRAVYLRICPNDC